MLEHGFVVKLGALSPYPSYPVIPTHSIRTKGGPSTAL